MCWSFLPRFLPSCCFSLTNTPAVTISMFLHILTPSINWHLVTWDASELALRKCHRNLCKTQVFPSPTQRLRFQPLFLYSRGTSNSDMTNECNRCVPAENINCGTWCHPESNLKVTEGLGGVQGQAVFTSSPHYSSPPPKTLTKRLESICSWQNTPAATRETIDSSCQLICFWCRE